MNIFTSFKCGAGRSKPQVSVCQYRLQLHVEMLKCDWLKKKYWKKFTVIIHFVYQVMSNLLYNTLYFCIYIYFSAYLLIIGHSSKYDLINLYIIKHFDLTSCVCSYCMQSIIILVYIKNFQLVSQQYRAQPDCTDVQAGLAL